MSRNQRIKDALRAKGISQETLAERLGITQAAVGKQLNKEEPIDSYAFMEAVSELTGISIDEILTGDPKADVPLLKATIAARNAGSVEEQLSLVNESSTSYLEGKNIRPITVTVDRTGTELISYVPAKAQAGYKRGFGDENFISKLPAFSLPVLINKNKTHRMFQVDGNSMRQLGGGGLNDGDIVIGEYVEDIFTIRDNRVYVVVSTDGVIVKRCINRLQSDNKVLVCNSDNKSGEYPPIILHPNEILEVWELKAYLSKQLSFSTDLWDVINDLQVQQALMADKLKDLEQNNLRP